MNNLIHDKLLNIKILVNNDETKIKIKIDERKIVDKREWKRIVWERISELQIIEKKMK